MKFKTHFKFLLLTFFVINFSSCTVQQPTIEDISISNINYLKGEANLKLSINNPNAYELKISDVNIDIVIDNEKLATAKSITTTSLKAKSLSELDIVVSFNKPEGNLISFVKGKINQFKNNQDIFVHFNGSLVAGNFLSKRTIIINKTKTISKTILLNSLF
jgi:LEA14-like dessication related protein